MRYHLDSVISIGQKSKRNMDLIKHSFNRTLAEYNILLNPFELCFDSPAVFVNDAHF